MFLADSGPGFAQLEESDPPIQSDQHNYDMEDQEQSGLELQSPAVADQEDYTF